MRLRGLSRREFLGGAAGVAAAVALPPFHATRAVSTPLAGATVNLSSYHVSNYVHAADIFNGYIGLPMATTIQKLYMGHGSFPSQPSAKMSQLSAAGCQFLITIEPSKKMTPTERSRLAAWLAMLTSAGISYRVALWAEANNRAFATQGEWQTYWSYYAPTIQAAGVACCYDPGCNPKAIGRAEEYFPADPAPDELWMDFYATSFRQGVRIDTLIAQAGQAGIPTGLAEWGWHAGVAILDPMTMPWWNLYCSYLIHQAGEGNLGLGTIYFDSAVDGRATDVVRSASDPRIPMIQQVAKAT
jgi:hypothetical protein